MSETCLILAAFLFFRIVRANILLVALFGAPEGGGSDAVEGRGAEPDVKAELSEAGDSVGVETNEDCGVVEYVNEG